MIGSANFTKSALSENDEMMISFNQNDKNSNQIYLQLIEQINSYWNKAVTINEDFFSKYIHLFKKSKNVLDKLENKYTEKKANKALIHSNVLTFTWDEYFKKIQNDNYHSFDERLKLLETARGYFKEYESFQNMNDEIRKQIAGIKKFDPKKSKQSFDWAWFGSMAGAGYFKQKINENDKNISDALDHIPLNGEVTYSDYIKFINKFKNAFISTGGDGVATATRLLAIKRPDYFICLDNLNSRP